MAKDIDINYNLKHTTVISLPPHAFKPKKPNSKEYIGYSIVNVSVSVLSKTFPTLMTPAINYGAEYFRVAAVLVVLVLP